MIHLQLVFGPILYLFLVQIPHSWALLTFSELVNEIPNELFVICDGAGTVGDEHPAVETKKGGQPNQENNKGGVILRIRKDSEKREFETSFRINKVEQFKTLKCCCFNKIHGFNRCFQAST